MNAFLPGQQAVALLSSKPMVPSLLRILHLWLLSLCAGAIPIELKPSASGGKLLLGNVDTGCRFGSQGMFLECQETGSVPVPSNAFHAYIDCSELDTALFDRLIIEPGQYCAKLTYTQYLEDSGSSSPSKLVMSRNAFANISCLMPPLSTEVKTSQYSYWSDWYTEIKTTVRITGGNASHTGPSADFEIGNILFRSADKGVDAERCQQAVYELFAWDVQLLSSQENTHELQWTSGTRPSQSIKALTKKATVTRNVKDVRLQDLSPQIIQAHCSSLGDKNLAALVKLQEVMLLETPADEHKERLELLVDATQLPKGTEEIEVSIRYVFPEVGEQVAKVLLPVKDPSLPDRPDDSKPKSLEIWIPLAILVCLLAGGVFFYRRHRRRQREPASTRP